MMRDFAIKALTAFAGGMIAVVFVNFCVSFYRYVKRLTDIWPDGFS